MLLAMPMIGRVNAGPLIKWVDEHGQVHYGDAVPADQARLERKVLSNQGVTVETIERAKTPAEMAELKRQEELRAEEERKLAEQAAKDNVLLATFSSEDDMILTRDGKIVAVDTIIRLAKDRIRRVTQTLRDLAHEAAEIERSGQQVPDELHQQIAKGKAEILHHEEYIETQQQEQEVIRKKFAADIERFRYLRHQTAGGPAEQASAVREAPIVNQDVPAHPAPDHGAESPPLQR